MVDKTILVSVIMSTYNETEKELSLSIFSILNQTYKNIELIIVNDNPDNNELSKYLNNISDSRVKIIANHSNLGLVKSLNNAINVSSGAIIARMDADDISVPTRIEKQLEFMIDNNLDIVGSDITIIDENEQIINNHVHFPSTDRDIRFFIKYGNCLPHPTWLVKKELYDVLGGYRNVPSCEDYDFILRTICLKKYKLGNYSKALLKYRIRSRGISKKNEDVQYVLRDYLSNRRKKILNITEKDIKEYTNSIIFKEDVIKYNTYKLLKESFKNKQRFGVLLELLPNKYLYKIQLEKLFFRVRQSLFK